MLSACRRPFAIRDPWRCDREKLPEPKGTQGSDDGDGSDDGALDAARSLRDDHGRSARGSTLSCQRSATGSSCRAQFLVSIDTGNWRKLCCERTQTPGQTSCYDVLSARPVCGTIPGTKTHCTGHQVLPFRKPRKHRHRRSITIPLHNNSAP